MDNDFVKEQLSKMEARIRGMTTEDLQAYIEEQLKDETEDFDMLACVCAMDELKRRRGELNTPEQRLEWKMTAEHYLPAALLDEEERTDPYTGTVLTPSWHGEDCAGNGENGEECCYACKYYPVCFPTGKPTNEEE